MKENNLERSFYFRDSRLTMTFVGRFLVRVVGYVALLFILAAIATFLISKIPWLMSLAVLLLFFVFDYFVFRKEADRSLFEIPKKGGVNLADYVGPAAFSVLERALDKSSLNKTNLTMEIMKQKAKERQTGLLMQKETGRHWQMLKEKC